jgi:hypothetical protein
VSENPNEITPIEIVPVEVPPWLEDPPLRGISQENAQLLARAMQGGQHLVEGMPAPPLNSPAFFGAYQKLAAEGQCDGSDDQEYRRVLEEWLAAGRPSDVEAFVKERANARPS